MSDLVIAALIGAVATVAAGIVAAIIRPRSGLATSLAAEGAEVERAEVEGRDPGTNLDRNVLLMLSSNQSPPPEEDVHSHAARQTITGNQMTGANWKPTASSTHLTRSCPMKDQFLGLICCSGLIFLPTIAEFLVALITDKKE